MCETNPATVITNDEFIMELLLVVCNLYLKPARVLRYG